MLPPSRSRSAATKRKTRAGRPSRSAARPQAGVNERTRVRRTSSRSFDSVNVTIYVCFMNRGLDSYRNNHRKSKRISALFLHVHLNPLSTSEAFISAVLKESLLRIERTHSRRSAFRALSSVGPRSLHSFHQRIAKLIGASLKTFRLERT